jgi:hypothetical protein
LTLSGATTISSSDFNRNSSTGVVTAYFGISSGATTGAYTVNVTFNGPAGTESLTEGFTVKAAAENLATNLKEKAIR